MVTPSMGSRSGPGPLAAVGRSASSAVARVSAAMRRPSCHTLGSSSGPETTRTLARASRARVVTCSALRLGLIGAAMPAACAPRMAESMDSQFTEMMATASQRPMPRAVKVFAVRCTASARPVKVRMDGACQWAASVRHEVAGLSPQVAAARVTMS